MPPTPPRPPEQSTLLIKGADYLVRAADRIERDCDLLVQANRITGIGRYEAEPGWRVLDATGRAVIPGLVNAHTHLYQNFLKGLNDGLPLVDWCDDVLFPAADVIHADHRGANDQRLGYAWSLAAALEMIRSGTTCCINMDMTMDAVFQAWLDIGFRGVGAVTLVDQWIAPQLLLSTEALQQQALGYVERWHQALPGSSPASSAGRIQVILAPSTPFAASPEMLHWTREQRDRLDLAVQIHVAETRYEIEEMELQAGTTPLRYLERFGLVDDRLTAVHCVHMSDQDLDLLQERGVIPIYSPKSNMKLGSGIAPVAKMLERGIPVALATDGSASNDLLDMFEEMRVGALLQKVAGEDPSVLSAADLFRMATENGAKACRIDAGTLDPGRLADLVLVNLEGVHLQPVHDIVNSLVYCAKSSDVETVIIDGQVVMQERKLVTMDEQTILDMARERGHSLRQRSLSSNLYHPKERVKGKSPL
ncbi:MAG: amidohydrolase [Anaerolineae bacterium]|jgi:5-methylthioadenosine/S-adenosylhomocysteine deaminase